MRNRYRIFAHSVAIILLLTSGTKIYTVTGSAKVLDIPEALLPMSIRQALCLVAAIELAIVLVLWLSKNAQLKLTCIAWLGGNFLLYRIVSILVTVGKPCPCLGSITEKIPLKPATIDHILSAVVLYMVFGSLFFLRARGKREADGGLANRGPLSPGKATGI